MVVQNHGRRVATKFMTVLAQPSRGPRDRLGIVASRRLGGAVIRNRAKRRLREIFRQQQMSAARALDFVVIPRRELISAPFPVVRADFQAVLQRLRTQAGQP